MPFRYPEVIVSTLLDTGAVLTLETGSHERTFVLAPEHLLLPKDFYYHVPREQFPVELHHLHFQRLVAVGESRIEFFRGTDRIAYLVPLAKADELSQLTWRSWQRWREQHEDEYYETITALLRGNDPEAYQPSLSVLVLRASAADAVAHRFGLHCAKNASPRLPTRSRGDPQTIGEARRSE